MAGWCGCSGQRHARQPDTARTNPTLTAADLWAASLADVTLHSALVRLVRAIVGVGGVCAALATLYVTFRGFDDRDENRLIRFWTSVGVLIGLASLLVGGVGVGNAISSFLAGRLRTIAIMKCLGAPERLVFSTYFIQLTALIAIPQLLTAKA